MTLKILCKEKNIELVYWNHSSIRMEQFQTGGDHETNGDYESQQKQFKQFLFKSSRYLTDQIFGGVSEGDGRVNKILFVKDIPSFAYYDPRSFKSMLAEFRSYSKYSIVFTISSSNGNGEHSPNKLLGPDVRKELSIVEISFNAIAQTYLTKQLEKICQAESSLACLDKTTIQSFCASSNGDLRHAIYMLELAKVGGDRIAIQQPVASKKGTKKRGAAVVQSTEPKDKKILLESSLKDPSYNLFRGLYLKYHSHRLVKRSCLKGVGKLLHRKPLELNEDNRELFEIEKTLPDHLKCYERVPMSVNPEDVYNKLNITPDLLILYLYQNYLELFNLKSKSTMGTTDQHKQLDALSSMSDCFIHSDLISQKSVLVEPGSVQEARRKEISSLVSIRSVLFNFYFDEAPSTSKSGTGGVWMPLFKPFHYKVNDSKLERKKAAKSLILSNSSQDLTLQRYLTHMNQDFFTNYMPFMSIKSQLSNKRSNQSDHQILFNKCKPANSKLGLLKENDCDNNDNKPIDTEVKSNEKESWTKSNGFIYESTEEYTIEECF